MSDRAKAAAAAIVSAVRDADDDGAPYLAAVSEVVDSTTVKIRPFSAVTGTQQNYAVMRGATVKVGDVVVVLPLRGGKMSVVLGHFAAGTLAANDFHTHAYQEQVSATNTSVSTWVTLGSGTIVLPPGTWGIVASWSHYAWHTVAAHINSRLDIGGMLSYSMDLYEGTGNRRTMVGHHSVSGKSGNVSFAIQFKSDAAGTATGHMPGGVFVCRRTA